MSNSAPIVDRIRIIPRPNDFLDRNVGSSGEVFFNKATNSLRVYSGKDSGGFEIAKADLSNIADSDFLAKATSSGATSSLDIIYTADDGDALQWVEGAFDFGNNIIKYANAIQAEADLSNYDAGTYHGMTMHVHETGALYYAHGGEWRKLLTDTTYGDPVSAGYTDPLGSVAYSNDYTDLTNTPSIPTTILDLGISDGTDGQILSTDGAGNFTFIDAAEGGGGAGDVFKTIASDDGTAVASGADDTLNILGGTNISTEITTDTSNVTINLDSFAIEFLSNVSSSAPSTGQVLKWDGSQWAPAADIAEGGAGLDADTLDGFDSSYYLDYNNFTNTPTVATLASFSVGNELTASGDGAISYDNTSGVFRYTPPDLSSYLTAETDTLASVTGRGATTSTAVTFSGGITASTITTTGAGTPGINSASSITLTATDDVIIQNLTYPSSDGTTGQILTTNGSGTLSFSDPNFLQLSDTPGTFGTAGQVVAVNSSADGLEFISTGAGGEVNQNAFSNIAVSGQTTVEADSETDTLNLEAGTGISISTDAASDTVTITSTVTAGASNLTDLGDVPSGTTIANIYEPAIAMLRVDNNGATNYTMDSHYSGANPTVYALAGTTIAFDLSAIGGHPFEIQDPTGSPYNTGLVHVSDAGMVSTGTNAQGKDSGVLYWRIQESISGNYRYQCQLHASMFGTITVKRLSVI